MSTSLGKDIEIRRGFFFWFAVFVGEKFFLLEWTGGFFFPGGKKMVGEWQDQKGIFFLYFLYWLLLGISKSNHLAAIGRCKGVAEGLKKHVEGARHKLLEHDRVQALVGKGSLDIVGVRVHLL